MNIDSILTTDWLKLEAIVRLLEPFAEHTNHMQTNSFSLNNNIPVIFDLMIHLQDNCLEPSMVADLEQALTRFDIFTEVDSINFDPLPAAACLLSPDVAKTLLTGGPRMTKLLEEAKAYVIKQVRDDHMFTTTLHKLETSGVASGGQGGTGPRRKIRGGTGRGQPGRARGSRVPFKKNRPTTPRPPPRQQKIMLKDGAICAFAWQISNELQVFKLTSSVFNLVPSSTILPYFIYICII